MHLLKKLYKHGMVVFKLAFVFFNINVKLARGVH